MEQMITKSLTPREVDLPDEGRIIATFATLNTVDKDGDILARDSIGLQDVIVSQYDHAVWKGDLPIGKGTVTESGNHAIADLELFMANETAREHFEVIKGLGDKGQWSFGFSIIGKDKPTAEQRKAGAKRIITGTKVFEVSPVFRAAGVGTRTIAAKNESGDGLRCAGCRHYLGESTGPLTLVGMTKQSSEVSLKAPRDLRYCGKCRMINVYMPTLGIAKRSI